MGCKEKEIIRKLSQYIKECHVRPNTTTYTAEVYVELFCVKCGRSLGSFDLAAKDLQSIVYCSDCLEKYGKPVLYELGNDTTVLDMGNVICIQKKDGANSKTITWKVCYPDFNGRYITKDGKRYYI